MQLDSLTEAERNLIERNRYAQLADLDRLDYGDEEDDNMENFAEINLLKQKYEAELSVLRVKGGKKGRKGAATKGGQSGVPPPPKFDGECSYCKKKGHKRKDCRKRIADEKKKKGANSLEGDDSEAEGGMGSLEQDDDLLFGAYALDLCSAYSTRSCDCDCDHHDLGFVLVEKHHHCVEVR